MKLPAFLRASGTDTRTRAVVRLAWIYAAVVVGIIWIGAGVVYLSGSQYVCISCHEMRPQVDTWRTSAHSRIGCPSCHETPLPPYRFPETLANRAALMQRDLRAHFSGNASAIPVASLNTTPTITDATCLQCHDPSRVVTTRSDLVIQHAKHAARNKSCISCHLWTAHPVPETERPLLLMARCFTCHGREPGAKAPGTCETCHSKAFNGRPESHKSGDWRTAHGKAALTAKQPCTMCHEKSFCKNCHGLDMPHPADWVKGNPGHSTFGAQNRQVCAQCHTAKPDLCSMCHHQDQQSSRGPWIVQHPAMVAKRGAAFCMNCHQDLFCYDCHSKRKVSEPSATGQPAP